MGGSGGEVHCHLVFVVDAFLTHQKLCIRHTTNETIPNFPGKPSAYVISAKFFLWLLHCGIA